MRAEAGFAPFLAVAVLAAPLMAAGGWLPLELPVLVLLLALSPDGLRPPLRVVATAGLAALGLLVLLDLATGTALNRRFNPALDLPLVAAGWRLASGSLGLPLAAAAAAALLAGIVAAVAALWWATGRFPRLRARWPVALSVPVLALVLVDAAAPAGIDPPGSTAAGRLGWEHLRDAWRAQGDLARFRAKAADDIWAAEPPERLLAALAGRDVFLVFVESYGAAAITAPIYGPTVKGTLARADAALAAGGLASRSAWMTSPVVGGQSWLARASAVSGLNIDGDGRYRALLVSPRRTILHLAGRAGWTTAAVAPAITLPWPEAGWYGYDRVFAARDLGYRGLPFNWVTMPDQFTLAAVERLLLDPAPRAPVFAEIALISSHAPWTPIPPLLPWHAVGDGRVFDRFAAAGDPPDVVWRDPDRIRDQYRQAVDYALEATFGFVVRRAGTDPLFVILGDHQPAGFVSGDPAVREVPVHIVGSPALVARLDGWTPGLVPDASAPVLPMAALRDLLLNAFAEPAADRRAAVRPLPPRPWR